MRRTVEMGDEAGEGRGEGRGDGQGRTAGQAASEAREAGRTLASCAGRAVLCLTAVCSGSLAGWPLTSALLTRTLSGCCLLLYSLLTTSDTVKLLLTALCFDECD